MGRTQALWDTAATRAAAESGNYGEVVRAVRRAHNLTLAQLAQRSRYSASTLSRLETGRQQLSDVRVLRDLATALQIPPRLLGLADTPRPMLSSQRPVAIVGGTPVPDKEAEPMHRRTLLTGLPAMAGTAILGSFIPASSPVMAPLQRLENFLFVPSSNSIPAGTDELEWEIAATRAAFDHGRYNDTAARLPALLSSATATRDISDRDDKVAKANAMLAESYVLASKLTVKLGHDRLAWIAADRALRAAHDSGNQLTQAAAYRTWSIVLRRAGYGETGRRLNIETAESLQLDLHRGPQYLAEYGSLLSTAAYTAAVDGDRSTADTLINEAIDTAMRLNEHDRFAAFGPAIVGGYQISISRVLGDYGTAIDTARRINPAGISSPERRARYWTDVARVFHQWDKPEHCYRALLAAEKASPDEIRYRKPIQEITTSLLRCPGKMPGIHGFARRAGAPSTIR